MRENKPAKLTLAHINDTHSNFEAQALQLQLKIGSEHVSPYVSNGGFARIVERIKKLKTVAKMKHREFMFFHAGDSFQGTLYFSLFKGKANSEMLNALGIDAMTLGNHELDMGSEPIADFLQNIQFPLFAGNWDLSNERKDKSYYLSGFDNLLTYQADTHTAKWMIRLVDDEPIAIFGLTLDKMDEIANVDSDTPFVNTFETAKNTVHAIQQSGINKIILLSHLGFEIDCNLAKAVPGISVIIGGHSHTLQGDFSDLGLKKEIEYGHKVNNTYIVQSGCYAQALGHCEIDFAADGGVRSFKGQNELLLGDTLYIDVTLKNSVDDETHKVLNRYLEQHPNIAISNEDTNILDILEKKYRPRVRKLQNTVIGEIDTSMRHIRIPDLQGGSDIAPLVAKSFAKMMRRDGHRVDFAIHNAGGVRASITSGKISIADIAGKILPFAIPIGVYQIKGKYISQILEGAINNATNNGVLGTGTGSYPYTYNLNFRYHADRPFGKRIANLAIFKDGIGWTEIEHEKIYHGSSSAYTMKGKEGYSALTMMEGDGILSQHSMADCFINFLREEKLSK